LLAVKLDSAREFPAVFQALAAMLAVIEYSQLTAS
jgi:hypothetical protein